MKFSSLGKPRNVKVESENTENDSTNYHTMGLFSCSNEIKTSIAINMTSVFEQFIFVQNSVQWLQCLTRAIHVNIVLHISNI